MLDSRDGERHVARRRRRAARGDRGGGGGGGGVDGGRRRVLALLGVFGARVRVALRRLRRRLLAEPRRRRRARHRQRARRRRGGGGGVADSTGAVGAAARVVEADLARRRLPIPRAEVLRRVRLELRKLLRRWRDGAVSGGWRRVAGGGAWWRPWRLRGVRGGEAGGRAACLLLRLRRLRPVLRVAEREAKPEQRLDRRLARRRFAVAVGPLQPRRHAAADADDEVVHAEGVLAAAARELERAEVRRVRRRAQLGAH